MPLYAIQDPKGKLIGCTVSDTAIDRGAKSAAWNYLNDWYPPFERAFVELDDDTQMLETETIGKRLGYRCVRVYLTTEKPKK